LEAEDSCRIVNLRTDADPIAFDAQELSTATAYTWVSADYSIDDWLRTVFKVSSFEAATWGQQYATYLYTILMSIVNFLGQEL
jgi:hypothetical protein